MGSKSCMKYDSSEYVYNWDDSDYQIECDDGEDD